MTAGPAKKPIRVRFQAPRDQGHDVVFVDGSDEVARQTPALGWPVHQRGRRDSAIRWCGCCMPGSWRVGRRNLNQGLPPEVFDNLKDVYRSMVTWHSTIVIP